MGADGQLTIPGVPEPKPEPAPIAADDVRRGLERRYRDKWTVLHEVAHHVGYEAGHQRRYIDTVAVGMTRESGYGTIYCHEIKVSRSDWLSEMRQPEKHRAFLDRCHRFYFVAPKGVILAHEVLPDCGLLIWYPSQIRIVRDAHLMRPVVPPRFWTAILSRTLNPKREELDRKDDESPE